VHKVAEPTSRAFTHLVLSTTRFSEVGDWRELSVNWSSSEPSVVQIPHGFVGILFPTELYVDVANQVIPEIVANVHLLDLPIFVLEFHENILEKVIEVELSLFVGHGYDARHRGLSSVRRLGGVLGVLVQVLEEDGLGKGGLVVEPRAPVAVSTGSDLEVEGTVDFVLLCAED